MTFQDDWETKTEPFSKEDEYTTENGTHVEPGETYLVKPKYIRRRLNAECVKVCWVPYELGEDMAPCVLHAGFRFHPECEAWSHMESKYMKVEVFNVDFIVGDSPRIRRDRANCNVENSMSVPDDYDPSDAPLPTRRNYNE
jgi:hypothetical protein